LCQPPDRRAPDPRAHPTQSWFWDGSYQDDRVNVRIPVSSATAKGAVYGAAIRIGDRWEVLGCEVRLDEVSRGAVEAVKAAADRGGGGEDEVQLPDDPARFAGLSYDVVGRRWLSGVYEIKAESDFVAAHAKTAASVKVDKAAAAAAAPARS